MARKRFNWKFAIILTLGILVVGATAYSLRKWNRSQRAEKGLTLGLQAYDQGNWSEAASQLGRYVALHQKDVEILLKYAQAQLNIRPQNVGNINQAQSSYRIILRQDPGNRQAAERLINLYLYQIREPAEAENIARKNLAVQPDPTIQWLLAASLTQRREYPQAIQELKKLIEINPNEFPAYELLAAIAQERPGDLSQPPIYWFDQAVEKNPQNRMGYIMRASYYLSVNQKEKALADIQKIELISTTSPETQKRLVALYIRLEQFDKAQEILEQSAPTPEKYDQLDYWQLQAQLALRSGDKQRMLHVAQAGWNSPAPSCWDFAPTAVELYIQAQDYDNAAQIIDRLNQKEMYAALMAYYQGIIAYNQDDFYNAIESFHRSGQIGYNVPRLHLFLASAFRKTGNLPAAEHELQMLTSQQPGLFQAQLDYAQILLQQKKPMEAISYAQRAYELEPENINAVTTWLRTRMNVLDRQNIPVDSEYWQNLAQDIEPVIEKYPDDVGLKILRLELYLQKKDLAQASRLLLSLQKDYPDEIEVRRAAIELLLAQKNYDSAEEALQAMVRDDPSSVGPVRTLALFLMERDKEKQAQDLLQKALNQIQDPLSRQALILLWADLLRKQGMTDLSRQKIEELISQFPRDILLKRRLLTYDTVLQNPERTRQLIDQIKEVEGLDGWQWRYEQARLWLSQDDFSGYITQIVSLLKENRVANPDDQASRLLLGQAYRQNNNLQLALSTFREAYERDPGQIPAIISLVSTLHELGEYAEAEKILNQAAKEKLVHPAFQQLTLQQHLLTGQTHSGADVLEQMIQQDPDNQKFLLLLASLKTRQGQYEQAEKLLDQLRENQPDSIPVAAEYVQLKIKQGQEDEALTVCDELVAGLNSAPAHLLRARTFAAIGRADQALGDYEKATQLEAAQAGAWLEKSEFLSAQGKLNDALEAMQKALTLDPENLLVKKRAISLYFDSRNPEWIAKAERLLEETLSEYPDDPQLRYYKALALLHMPTCPRWEQAREMMMQLTEQYPKEAYIWSQLANLYIQEGQAGKALDTILRGLVFAPKNKELQFLKAQVESRRSPAVALGTLKNLLDLYPDDAGIILSLSDMYMLAGQCEKAVTLLSDRIEKKPPSDLRKYRIAFLAAQYKCQNKQQAADELLSLYRSSPDDLSPLLTLARLARDDQDWQGLAILTQKWHKEFKNSQQIIVLIAEDLAANQDHRAQKAAEQIYRMILADNKDDLPALQGLAILLQMLRQFDPSIELYEKVLQQQPENVIALNNLAWILCQEKADYERARQLVELGIQKSPDYLDLIDTQGMVYYRMGQYEKALENFKRCVTLYLRQNPALAGSYFHLACTQAKLGYKQEAMASLQQALTLNKITGGLTQQDLRELQTLRDEISS